MLEPAEIVIVSLTIIVICVLACEPTASVIVTVSITVPRAAVGPTVTTPVEESIVMPVNVGESEKIHGPVPFARVNAVDVTVRPNVDVTFDPPPILTSVLTRTREEEVAVAPTWSVAVTTKS